MIIKVLGSGCSNCQKVKAMAAQVTTELGIDATVEAVTDMQDIMSYGVISTPGLVIDEKLVGSGGVPTKAQMTTIILDNVPV